jgi:hypothetical protein
VIRYLAIVLALLPAGCASVASEPPASQPGPVATQPPTPQPVAAQPPARPVTPAAPPPASAATPPPSVKPPATQGARSQAPPGPTPALAARGGQPAAPPVAAPPPSIAPKTLDLDALEAQLKATKAIGVFTKISLKNKVDDLMKQFREYYQGQSTHTLPQLRVSYDLLMMKVLTLLQDGDHELASAVVSSREAIWSLLSDEKRFAALES